MSRDQDTQAGIIMMAFVMGAITGAATALLMAPASGTETRRTLNERAREGRERAGDAARQGADFVRRQKDQLSTAVDRGREAYQRAPGSPTRWVPRTLSNGCHHRVPGSHRAGDAGDGYRPGRDDHLRREIGAAGRPSG